MSRKPVFVWGRVMTVDYYGAFEGIVIYVKNIPMGIAYTSEGLHESSKAGKLENVTTVQIKNRQAIKVRWPDKDETYEKLCIEEGHDSAQVDMISGPDRFETRHLFVITKFNGLKVKVPLSNLKVGVWL